MSRAHPRSGMMPTSMTAYHGKGWVMLVICVDDTLPRKGRWCGDPVEKGEIYTVRESVRFHNEDGFLLYEARTRFTRRDGSENGYLQSRFRPLKDSSLDVFREIVRDVVVA